MTGRLHEQMREWNWKFKPDIGYMDKCVCNAHVLTFREFTLSISTLRRKYHIHATIEK